MRKNVILASLFMFTLTTTALASCGANSNWNYSKAEMAKCIELNTNIEEKEDGKLNVKINNKDSLFKNNLSASSMLLYNSSEVESESYRQYKDVQNHLIKPENIQINQDYLTFDFNGDINNNYEIIIHKDGVMKNNYAMGYIKKSLYSKGDIIQTDFEETIIKSKGSWSDAQKGINVASGIAQVIFGIYTANPVAVSGGTFGACSALGSIFLGNKGATLDSVSKQLTLIDSKIDALNDQIDKNQKQIIDEFVKTQAMIDEVKINQYNQNIQAYQTDYVKPIDDFLLVYKDMLEQEFRKYINDTHSVKVYYGKDSSNKKIVLFESEDGITNANSYEYTITDYKNAKAYLDSNKGLVGNGYPEALCKDIKEAVKNDTLPEGRDLDTLVNDIYATIANDVNQSVLTKEDSNLHAKILQFASNYVSYAKAIAGINFESVINSYISRLEYIYNFSIETKDLIKGLLANLKIKLDSYLCIAQTACFAQKINYIKEIANAYTTAADYIKSRYDAEMERPDNYSYALKCKVNGDLYQVIAEVSFTNLGNTPTFHGSFVIKNKIAFDGSNISGNKVDVNSLKMVDYKGMRSITTRYNLLKSANLTKSATLIKYLNNVGIVSNESFQLLNRLCNSGRYDEFYGRILTSFAIRDLNDSDSIPLRCQCYGNAKSEFFYIGQYTKYRYDDGTVEREYWSGKMAYGDVLSSETGNILSNKRLATYAKYSESHKLWFNDEHWGFIDEIFGNFYYIFTKA